MTLKPLFLTAALLFSIVPTYAQNTEQDRHQLYVGYGAYSARVLGEETLDFLFDDILGIKTQGGYGGTSGVTRLGYNFRVKNDWMLHLEATQEHFSQSGDAKTSLIGFRKEYVQPGKDMAIYWGIAGGRYQYDYDSGAPSKHQMSWQIDLGLRANKGPLFGFVNLGLGDAGTLGAGIGVSF